MEKKCVEASMKWYGWGSPVGLIIFLIGLSVCALLIKKLFS